MKCEMIGTWKMAKDAFSLVKNEYRLNRKEALIKAISSIEDREDVHTVGRFSCPNEDGFLELDAAFMDGKGNVGAVLSARKIVNPIAVAADLMYLRENNILTSFGADRYAMENGFETKDVLEVANDRSLCQHDTVAMIGRSGELFEVGVSSSGRKGKHLGRVGDSPLIGSGYYAEDGVGAAAATGDGEAILKGVLAKEVVDRMMCGSNVKDALYEACERQKRRLSYPADFCMIAMDKEGNFSAYTSKEPFPFATMNDETVTLWVAYPDREIREADEAFLKEYKGD